MRQGSPAPYGAAAGAAGIVLYVAGSLVMGDRPGFDAGGAEIAADLEENRTRIQLGCAILAAWTPLFVWFLATVASLAGEPGSGARRAAAVAFGCGLVFTALFLVDVTTLAVSALRPENMAADPELAVALRDFEWLAMGSASFVMAGVLAAFAALVLEHARSGGGGSAGWLWRLPSSTCCAPARSSPPTARSPRTGSWASTCRSWRWRAGS